MLRDVSERDTSVELFGSTLPSPFLIGLAGCRSVSEITADTLVPG
ncbi:MAG: hypothetical protein ABW142_08900 [Thermoleophilaceae bacterium]